MLTHPDADHVTGLVEVFRRYEVHQLVRLAIPKETQIYQAFLKESATIPMTEIFAGDRLSLGNTKIIIDVVWPSLEYYDSVIGNNPEVNLLSIVAKLSYGNVDVLLTGDIDERVNLAQTQTGLLTEVEILKVPHHGSKTGFTPEWLNIISPELALISVGAKNRYGHPGKNILDMFATRQIPVLRTDQVGNIEIDIDQTGYSVR